MTKIPLPNSIVSYCHGLLRAPFRFNMVILSFIVAVSHDTFTRMLRKHIHWKAIFWNVWQHRYNLLQGGYVIIDETEINKSFAKAIQGLHWIRSRKEKRCIYGYQLVVMCWTNGTITIPFAWKIYQAKIGVTKTELALQLIHYCLTILKMKPEAFLFDAFYASERILKYLTDHNQYFFSQAPKSRLLDKTPLKKHEKGRPYWTKTGYLRGRIKVQVVKNRCKYFITNALGCTRKKQLATYKIRWRIEEVFRFTKDQLGLEACQSTSKQAQHNHFGCCFITYALLQDIAATKQMTVYALKQQATINPDFASSIDFSIYLNPA